MKRVFIFIGLKILELAIIPPFILLGNFFARAYIKIGFVSHLYTFKEDPFGFVLQVLGGWGIFIVCVAVVTLIFWAAFEWIKANWRKAGELARKD